MKTHYLGLVFIFLIVLGLFCSGNRIIPSKTEAVFCLIMVLVGTVMSFSLQKRSELKGYWLKPSNVLLLGLMIVNFQNIVDYILGLKSLEDFVRPNCVIKSCYVSALAIIAYLLGLWYRSSIKVSLTKSLRSNKSSFPEHVNTTFLVVLQILFFVAWLYTVDFASLIMGLQYGSGTGSSNMFEGLFFQCTIALLTCIAINCHGKNISTMWDFLLQNNIASWICIILYMLVRLVSGDRGPFIYMGFAVFFTYVFATKYRPKLISVIAVLYAFSVMISVVGMARLDAASGTFWERFEDSFNVFSSQESGRFSDRTVFKSTEELAYSIRCNLIAIDEIDNGYQDLHHGKFQLFQVLNMIPFMPSFLTNTLGISPAEMSSDYNITEIYFGDFYISGQTGTTCVADFYLDFGLWGIVFGMFIMGLIFRRVDSVICVRKDMSILIFIIALLFACKCYYIPRSSFISQIKPIIPILLLFYINYFVFNSGNKSVRKHLRKQHEYNPNKHLCQ